MDLCWVKHLIGKSEIEMEVMGRRTRSVRGVRQRFEVELRTQAAACKNNIKKAINVTK